MTRVAKEGGKVGIPVSLSSKYSNSKFEKEKEGGCGSGRFFDRERASQTT